MKNHLRFQELLLLATAVALFLTIFPVPVQAEGELYHYFGQLHSHSGSGDTIGDPAEVYTAVRGKMDFFGLTDYSHSFDNADSGAIGDGSIESSTWISGKQAAAAATKEDFSGFFGFEMGNKVTPLQNHIAAFATPGWQSRNQEGFSSVNGFLDALVTVPGAFGMFCHPDPTHADFSYFKNYRWDYDDQMPLLEVMGEDGQTFFDAYQTALDEGWHVAPAASEASHDGSWGSSSVRTVLLAESRKEADLFDAIRARRVYATTNPDLKITYRLGGHLLGSRLTSLDGHRASVRLSHPEGELQVLTAGGKVLAALPAAADMAFDLEPGHPYYYLRLVKDGSVTAITAPVWIENPTKFGASQLTADKSVPLQGEDVTFSCSFYNHETVPMTVHSLRLLADGELIWQQEGALTLAAGETKTISLPYTHHGAGVTEFTLEASGTIAEVPFTIQKTLTLSYRPQILNAHILVDGRHSSITLDNLKSLTALASEADMDVGIFRQETPEGARVLIVPPLEVDFSEMYPQLLKSFVENGGHLILWGQAGDNSRSNSLLEALGSTLRFCDGAAKDPVHNGGIPESIYTQVFSDTSQLPRESVYAQLFGCTVDPGSGAWLVKGKDTMEGLTPFLLARDGLGSGQITISGSSFLDDEHLLLPRNPWDSPSANQLLLESILEIQRTALPITGIQEVRRGNPGDIFRVTGYVTAGTSREHNRFPNLIYLQDGTGGMEITDFTLPDIQVGFCLDITGQLHMDGNNPALKLISCRVVENDLYCHDPPVSDHKTAMDYETYGGQLMKIEGTAQIILYTPDGLGVRYFTLKDANGDRASVLIEDYILSGADGVNHLAGQVIQGKAVRAYGILHLTETGLPVLRVRNCDEVVHIPPLPETEDGEKNQGIPDLSNPNTGDPFTAFFTFLGF